MKQKMIRLIAIFMLTTMLCTAFAEMIEPYASTVISVTGITGSAGSGGEVKFKATITGTKVLDKLGFPSIEVQEKNGSTWSKVKGTINKYKFNAATHTYTITYAGTVGKEYRCIASFYAQSGSDTDSRVRTSATVTAKN